MSYNGKHAVGGNVDNLLTVYDLASAWEIEQGKNWYSDAYAYTEGLAKKHSLTIDTTARVIAVLSPNNKWEWNKRDADTVIKGWKADIDWVRIRATTFKRNIAKAYKILDGEPGWLRGEKVTAFYQNIMQPDLFESVVTVDIWAWRAWVFDSKRPNPSINPPLYKKVAADYYVGADMVDLPPQHFQAIVWEVTRRAGRGRTCQLRQMRLL